MQCLVGDIELYEVLCTPDKQVGKSKKKKGKQGQYSVGAPRETLTTEFNRILSLQEKMMTSLKDEVWI